MDITARTISRIKRDLTGRETIVPKGETIDAQNTVNGLNSVEGLAVDWVAGNYFKCFPALILLASLVY